MGIFTELFKGGNVEYEDAILSPMDEIVINYTGPNPFLICTIARPLLHSVLKVTASSSREDDIRWDDANPNSRMFYGVWRGKPQEDSRFTEIWVRLSAHGYITNLKENTGDVVIRLRGHIYTNFSWKLPGMKSFWMLYNYFWYWKQRRATLEYNKDKIFELKERILEAYKINQEK